MKKLNLLLLTTFIISSVFCYTQTVSVSIVGGNPDNCTSDPVAGTYSLSGTSNGRNQYVDGGQTIRWDGAKWILEEAGFELYYNNSNTTLPPCGNWLGSFGCFTINVTGSCSSPCTNPTVPTVTFTPSTVCTGGTASLNISGTLNDATAWQVYTGSCGGTNIGSTTTSTFAIPGTISSSTTYFVRGEGGCVAPGSCGSVTITPTALDDASFSYGSAAYCVNAADPTPTITGDPGGTFSSTAGLSINTSTGQIDVSASTPNTYTVTYNTAGTCPNSSNVSVTINALPTVTFTALADLCVNAGVQAGLGGGSPTGGVYSGTGVTDDGNGMTYSFNPATAGVGTHTITYTFTDGNGCTNSASDNVEVFALPTVTITALADLCVNAGVQTGLGGGSPTGGVYSGTGVTDDGNGMTYSFDPATAGVGTHAITYSFTNGNGCTNSASDNVEVFSVPSTPSVTTPLTVCPGFDVILSATGSGTGDLVFYDNTMTEIGRATMGGTANQVFNNGALANGAYTFFVTEDNGSCESPSATINVTVEDNTNPTAVCQNITVFLDGTGSATITGSDIDGGSSDNCAVSSLTPSTTSFTCADIGANSVTLTVTDASANTASCLSTVTVVDTTSPTAVCQNITVYLDATGNASITAGDVDGGSTDNCGVAGLSVSPAIFTCADVGANNVTLTVTDASANSSTCTAIVTVVDTNSPTAVCQNITVFLDGTGNATITGSDIDGGSSDNCAVSSLTPSTTSFTCADIGANSVTLTVADASANTSTCVSTVTVVDTTSPTATCQNITVYLDGAGNATITGTDIDNGSTDNCGVSSLTPSVTSFTCADIGANSVTLTVADANANTSTCVSTVTVSDTIRPTVVCQNITVYLDATGNVSITAGDVDNGTTDNCGIASLGLNQTSFTCAEIGVNNVTLTAEDVNGNIDSCIATVTVADTTSPTAVCQNITVYLDGAGNATITGTDIDNGSTDNCGVSSLIPSTTSFTCADVGPNNVTLTVADANANTSTCTSVVTVADTTSPTAVCQNITVYLDATGSVSIVAGDVDGGSTDNCGISSLALSQTSFDCSHVGANNVTLTVNDVNGNSSTCVAVVTVSDTTRPVVVCQNSTVYLDNSGLASISVADVDAGSSDNCGIDTSYLSNMDFSCADLGMNMVTLTVIDSNGNIDSCTATITVMDTLYRGDSLTVVACGSYIFSGDTLTMSGWYADTTQILGGCDSITVLDLTVNPLPTITITDINNEINSVNCFGDSGLLVAGGAETYNWFDARTSDSIYYVFDTAAQFPELYVVGTDSNLCSDTGFFISGGVYDPVPVTNVIDSVCDRYVSPSGNYVWTATGIYNDTLSNINGCDSIIVTDLTIYNSYNDTLAADTICNGDSILILGSYQGTAGWYVDSSATSFGCDSVTHHQLVVLPNTVTVFYDSICYGDSLLIGSIYYSESGVYNDTVGNSSNGCYILEQHNLTVKTIYPAMLGEDISECQEATVTLYAGDYYDGYLWQDGSTDSTLVIDGNIYGEGSHVIMVTVTDDSTGCQDSDTLNITFNNCTDITEVDGQSLINIYPNPTNGLVTIDVSQLETTEGVRVDVFGVHGQLILSEQIVDTKQQIDLLSQPNGMYTVSIKTPTMQVTRRLIIQH